MKYAILVGITFILASCASQNAAHYEMWRPKVAKTNLATKEFVIDGKKYQLQEIQKEEPKVVKVERRNPVYQGIQYLDYTEKENTQELEELTGVNPIQIEWCAAFANAILEQSNIPSNKDHKYALTARSFLDWGVEVEQPVMGDIVVFPRGDESWQGHVGFFVKAQVIDDTLYYYILGGNQKNSVNVELYPAGKALSVRRAVIEETKINTDSNTAEENK